MKKVTIKAPDSKPEIEKLKKIYRLISDVVSKHDQLLKRQDCLNEIFASDAILLRDRLQEYCEKLLFNAPIELRLKVEEILWRKCYYDVIKLIRKAGKMLYVGLLNSYNLHLKSGSGFYIHLLLRLQHEFNLNLGFDFSPSLIAKPLQRANRQTDVELSSELLSWSIQLCHKILIYLGDLARYESDAFENSCRLVAQRFYYQAIHLNSNNGMAYNQLATLAGRSHYSLHAAYYYFRCLLSVVAFDGAHANLLRLFEANRIIFKNLKQQNQPVNQLNKGKEVKKLVVEMLLLVQCFYSNQSSIEGIDVKDLCELVLSDLNICLTLRQVGSRLANSRTDLNQIGGKLNNNLSDKVELDGDAVFKMLIILISCVHIMLNKGGVQLGAGIAMILAAFSQLLNHANLMLHSNQLSNKRHIRKQSTANKIISKKDELPIKKKKTQKCKLEGLRRGRGLSEDSLESFSDNSLAEDVSSMLSSEDSVKSEGEEGDESDISSESDLRFSSQDSNKQPINALDDVDDDDASTKIDLAIDSFAEVVSKTLDNDVIDEDLISIDKIKNENIENSRLKVDWSQYQNFNKEIPIPPGFERSAEMLHVQELSAKLAMFDIDTDTETCNTDLDNAYIEESNNIEFVNEILNVVSSNYLLPTIKVLCDWLLANPDVITNCAKVSSNIWLRLSILLNYIPTLKQLLNIPGIEMLNLTKEEDFEKMDVEGLRLPEDLHLLAFAPLPNNRQRPIKSQHISNKHQCIVRLCCLHKFGCIVSKMSSIPLTFNTTLQLYHATQQPTTIYSNINATNMSDPVVTMPKVTNNMNITLAYTTAQSSSCNINPNNNTSSGESIIAIDCAQKNIHGIHVKSPTTFPFANNTSCESNKIFSPTLVDDNMEVTSYDNDEMLASKDVHRQELMRGMALLRLASEVNQLENSVKQSDRRVVYVVLDGYTNIQHLRKLQGFAIKQDFTIVVPIAVVDLLDVLKKESSEARDVIRWLEKQLHDGHKCIRAQKKLEQTLQYDELKIKFKKDKTLTCLLEVIDCATYLANNQKALLESANAHQNIPDSSNQLNLLNNQIKIQPLLTSSPDQQFISTDLNKKSANLAGSTNEISGSNDLVVLLLNEDNQNNLKQLKLNFNFKIQSIQNFINNLKKN